MREVSCKATRMILEVLEDAGIAVGGIDHGLGATARELADPRGRIDWNVFVEFLARVEAAAHGVLSPEEIGERLVEVPSSDWLRWVGRLAVSPRQLYGIGTRFVAPALFANVTVSNEWLPSGQLDIRGELLPGYRESTMFFRLCHGNVAAVPRVLDLPASTVEESSVSGRSGRLVLVLPPAHTLVARARRALRVAAAAPRGWRVIARQQRALEASLSALHASRRELQQLLERLPDGVLIHERGVIRWANRALAEMAGVRDPNELVGRSVLDFVVEADREDVERALSRTVPSEEDAQRETRVVRADGSVRRVQSGVAQPVELGGARAHLLLVRDVTDHHRLREQAAISDRLASIGALAAGVAHEINNPLAYVRLSLEMAARKASETGHGDTSDLRTSLALAREGTERVIGIVQDLKTLSRTHGEKSEVVDLPNLLDSTLALAASSLAAKARVVRAYGAAPQAVAPRGKLGQVFLNLLSNAADAIPEGAAYAHVIEASTRTDARGRAVVEISDTGCGIAPEIRHRVFDAFFTTKPVGVGTGLGLAMCHRIVTELGGEIGFESTPGKTTFRVTLPPAPAAVDAVAGPAETR